jgi:hypothetical protein
MAKASGNVEQEVINQDSGGEQHRGAETHAAGVEAYPRKRDEEREHDCRHADEVRCSSIVLINLL